MYKTIEDFNLTGQLTDYPINREIDRFGDITERKEARISEGVTLILFNSGQAALEFAGIGEIEFLWTPEVAEIFERIGDATAIELLNVIQKNKL
ncbi:hypothetical protein ACFFIS_04790 [Virgibacillus soli]|uniref:Uncharacterized protein n=1 Tax=Paracerasibacillus soli TaxID=480284 RepID=A0ABU5CUA7_9BACI|nr:hypothetical protein [Virgibacillus soli]MDY0409956.1 hypothetical protein [Virgibacillus soli]